MDDGTVDLILSLQLEDLLNLNRDSKTTGEHNVSTDAQMAFSLFQEELHQHALILSDHRLGEKVGQMPGIPTRPPSPIESPTPTFDHVLARSIANQGDDPCWGASNIADTLECVACGENKPTWIFLTVPCGHQYCDQCISELFDLAMKDESLFPPRCCKESITLYMASVFLNELQVRLFESKSLEYATQDKTYCHEISCQSFILPCNIDGEKATCQDCGLMTCTICKSAVHDGDCPQDPAHVALMATAAAEGYQTCSQCKRLVELNFGCYHITSVQTS